MQEIFRIFLY